MVARHLALEIACIEGHRAEMSAIIITSGKFFIDRFLISVNNLSIKHSHPGEKDGTA
jgi:hypothetical protein